MELLFLLLIIGAAFLLRGRSGKSRGTGRRVPPVYRPNPTSLSRRKVQPGRFDAQTAKPDIKHLQLRGRAYVIDGDSLVIQNTQVRLFGVDAPELNHPYGQKAKWALHDLCKGQTIRAEVIALDAHGRTVATCYLDDGRDLSAEMVRCGMAIDWPKFSDGAYRDLETENARKKLWLADARQKGRMHVWDQFDYDRQRAGRKPSDE